MVINSFILMTCILLAEVKLYSNINRIFLYLFLQPTPLESIVIIFSYHTRLSGDNGVITDGDGKYAFPSKCSWLIESKR